MKEASRQDAVLEALAERGLGALIVTDLANVRYLTGYVGSNGVAVIGPRGRSLLTDSRYAVAARASGAGRRRRHRAPRPAGRRAPRWSRRSRARGRWGWRPRASPWPATAASRRCSTASPEPTTGIVETLREVKDADEVEAMRRGGRRRRPRAGCGAGARASSGAPSATSPSPSTARCWTRGPSGRASRPSSPPARTGRGPTPSPARSRSPPNTLVIIDLGAVVDGYCSDMTRTVATGPLPPRLAEIYEVCLRAQQAALDAARAGMGAAELDAVARAVIAEAGYADAFGHGLGHGVGLAIHEAPGVRPEGDGHAARGHGHDDRAGHLPRGRGRRADRGPGDPGRRGLRGPLALAQRS